jgi:hypothetical protein
MRVIAYLQDHKAATLDKVSATVEEFIAENPVAGVEMLPAAGVITWARSPIKFQADIRSAPDAPGITGRPSSSPGGHESHPLLSHPGAVVPQPTDAASRSNTGSNAAPARRTRQLCAPPQCAGSRIASRSAASASTRHRVRRAWSWSSQ